MKLFELYGDILLKDEKARQGLDDIDSKAKKTDGKFRKMAKTASKWGAGLVTAATAAAAGLFALTNNVAETGDKISKTATKMGISTDALQEMDYWASQNGISSETLERGVGRLNQRLGLAAQGNEKYSNALKTAGVSMEAVREGTISTEDAMATAVMTISQMSTEQEKSAAASELFGTKMARDLMPALQNGSLSLEEAKQKAHEMGIVLSGEALGASVKYQDTMDNVTRSFGALWQKIAIKVMPIFQTMLEWIMTNLPVIKENFSIVFTAISTAISTGVEWISKIMEWMQSWQTENEGTLSAILLTFMGLFEAVKNLFQGFIDFAILIWTNWGNEITTVAQAIWDVVMAVIKTALDLITDIFNIFGALFSGDWEALWEGVKTLVSNIWDNIGGIIIRALELVKSVVRLAWNVVKNTISSLLGQIWTVIKNKFSDIVSSAQEKMGEVKTKIEDAWNKAKGYLEGINLFSIGKDIIQGLLDGISNMASSVWSKATEIADGVKDRVKGALSIFSPSRVMMELGEYTGKGFEKGLENSEEGILNKADDIAMAAVPEIRTTKNETNQSKSFSPIINFYSPKELSPSEQRRKQEQLMRKMAMEYGV